MLPPRSPEQVAGDCQTHLPSRRHVYLYCIISCMYMQSYGGVHFSVTIRHAFSFHPADFWHFKQVLHAAAPNHAAAPTGFCDPPSHPKVVAEFLDQRLSSPY
jgi:hypothetical protein